MKFSLSLLSRHGFRRAAGSRKTALVSGLGRGASGPRSSASPRKTVLVSGVGAARVPTKSGAPTWNLAFSGALAPEGRSHSPNEFPTPDTGRTPANSLPSPGDAPPSSESRFGWLVLAALFYLLLAVFHPLGHFDEGLALEAGVLVNHGAVPYRDFVGYYTPGQYYTLAALFRLFGTSVLVARIWDTLVRFGLCVLAFLIARKLDRGKAAWLPFLVAVLYLGWCGFYGYSAIVAMFWCLLSVLLLLHAFPENTSSRNTASFLVLAGLAAGVTLLYRQDIGAYLCLSVAVAFALRAPASSPGSPAASGAVARRLRPILLYALGAAIVFLPVLLYFLRVVPAADLRSDFVGFLAVQTKHQALPLPALIPSLSYLRSSALLFDTWFLFYAPLVVLLLSGLHLLRAPYRAGTPAEAGMRRFGCTLLTLLGFALLLTTLTRADAVHCLVLAIPAAILLATLLADSPSAKRKKWTSSLASLLLLVLSVPYIIVPIARWASNVYVYGLVKPASSLPRARHFYVGSQEEEAIRFIQQRVPEDQPIFVGNPQHRHVLDSDVLFYFLAERAPATRFYEFIPGVVTTAPVQREIISELKRNRTRYVVLVVNPLETLPEQPDKLGSPLLDDFLKSHFRRVKVFGRYSILQRQ